MYTNENGEDASMSEGEYEALMQVQAAKYGDDSDDQEQVICAHDANPTLVVIKVWHQLLNNMKTNVATYSKRRPGYKENQSKW